LFLECLGCTKRVKEDETMRPRIQDQGMLAIIAESARRLLRLQEIRDTTVKKGSRSADAVTTLADGHQDDLDFAARMARAAN